MEKKKYSNYGWLPANKLQPYNSHNVAVLVIRDGYEEDGQLFMSGYSNEIGIVTAHGYTIKEAAEEMIEKAKGIRFPMRGMRSDLDRNDYHSSPQSRFDALDIMDYFDKI